MSIERRISRKALAVVAMLLLVGLAACGDDDDETDTAAGQPATTAVTTASPATTAAPAVSTTTPGPLLKTASNAQFGTILVDAGGKALYTFDRDTTPVSACTGNCVATWPPLLLPAGAATPIPATGVSGTLAASARPDGGSQITVNGKPLYRYAGDSNPGDVNGDGVGGIWHIATQA